MNNTRARFEEIWPVPEGVFWNEYVGEYDAMHYNSAVCDVYQARLDTFTRCQETTDVYVSLIKEMIDEIMSPFDTEYDGEDWCNRAKQIMEQKK